MSNIEGNIEIFRGLTRAGILLIDEGGREYHSADSSSSMIPNVLPSGSWQY